MPTRSVYSPGVRPRSLLGRMCVSGPCLRDERVAERCEAGDLHLDDIAGFEIGRAAVRTHPDHVAGIERKIAAHGADVARYAKDHCIGVEAQRLLAVEAYDRFESVEVNVGLDPRAHGFGGVGVLRTPERAVGLLPHPLADVVADGVSEHAGERLCL